MRLAFYHSCSFVIFTDVNPKDVLAHAWECSTTQVLHWKYQSNEGWNMSSKKCYVLLMMIMDLNPKQGILESKSLKAFAISSIAYNPDKMYNLYKKLNPLKC